MIIKIENNQVLVLFPLQGVRGQVSKFYQSGLFHFFSLFLFLNCSVALKAVSVNDFQARSFTSTKYSSNIVYRLYIPRNYSPSTSYPLVVFLHGSGERGNDNIIQLGNGAIEWADTTCQNHYPSFVLVPQCPNGSSWNIGRNGPTLNDIDATPAKTPLLMVIQIIDSLSHEFNIDSNRLYSTGVSMGGIGTWEMNLRYPTKFAACLPVCAASDPTKAVRILNKPIWAFHGAIDPAVPVEGSRNMINALKALGGTPKYTEYPWVQHNAWDYAYKEPDLFQWTFAQSLSAISVTKLSINTPSNTISINDSIRLSTSFLPLNATNQTIKWSSSNIFVAKVNQSGTVKAYRLGKSTITATSLIGNKTAICDIIVTDPFNDVSQIQFSPQIKIFPNPSNGENLIVSGLLGKSDISIFDITGKTVCQKSGIAKGLMELNDLSLNQGVYLVMAKSESINSFQKLMVK